MNLNFWSDYGSFDNGYDSGDVHDRPGSFSLRGRVGQGRCRCHFDDGELAIAAPGQPQGGVCRYEQQCGDFDHRRHHHRRRPGQNRYHQQVGDAGHAYRREKHIAHHYSDFSNRRDHFQLYAEHRRRRPLFTGDSADQQDAKNPVEQASHADRLQRHPGRHYRDLPFELDASKSGSVEAVVAPRSNLAGKTLPEIKLIRAIHDAPGILERFSHSKQSYLAYIRAALAQRISNDNVVYHGLAGHVMLKGISGVLKYTRWIVILKMPFKFNEI